MLTAKKAIKNACSPFTIYVVSYDVYIYSLRLQVYAGAGMLDPFKYSGTQHHANL